MMAEGIAPLPSREAAWALVCRYVQGEGLRRHMLGVETAMRAYARLRGADEERWGITGLLHDFDWEIHPTPEQHPELGCRMLTELGYPEDVVQAIRGHADYLGVPRTTDMAKALYACDELTGFLAAVAYVRPTRRIADVTVEAVMKKLADKRFAAGVNREEVYAGAREFGVDLCDHIAFLIGALSDNAAALGLG
jgi:putative nucleotidyltransferase with HDIG domain